MSKNEVICRVAVQRDHLAKISHANPERGLAELIWNALDADATLVEVFFVEGEVGTREIIVKDNGNGFLMREAENFFSALGGSWKAHRDKTDGGRRLHGKEGQGRFKAFTLGRCVQWTVMAIAEGGVVTSPFQITAFADRLEEFRIIELAPDAVTTHGVTVRISEPVRELSLFNAEIARAKLLPFFALYLQSYGTATINVCGTRLDPKAAILASRSFPLKSVIYNGVEYSAKLEVIEWREGGEKELWLCTESGFPIEQYPKQIRGVGAFRFSAYFKSDFISALANEGTLGLGELKVELRDVCESAIRTIKSHFESRARELGADTVQKWKEEEIYPFRGEAASPMEIAEREVFDVVATKVAENLPAFDESDKKSKAFQLRMLRHAVERGPEELQLVITEVLNLPKKALDQLTELLKDVSLGSLISASKLVTDRLKFIAGLELLLFDSDSKKTLKERSQLHKIVAENTWIFGQAYSMSVNDRSLTEVLRKHKHILSNDILIDEPVTRIDGSIGIVDLMLSRAIPRNREGDIEHLVVELKAPKVKIGERECSQIKNYAFAVCEDERFATLSTKWDFWVISNELDSYAAREANQDGRARGVLYKSNTGQDVTVWAITWAQIIRENKFRLEFIRDKLNYEVDHSDALQHLRNSYSQFTKGVVIDGEEVSDDL